MDRTGEPEMELALVGNAASSPSLEEVHSSVPIPNSSWWRRLLAFSGPAYLISVGYMDPGNWATDLQAGAMYRYGLLWVVVLASMMAVVMQVLSARLGIVTGKDLAQACRDYYPAWTRWPNWITCELAIAACDLAEVLGSAVALNLLFGIPLFWAVIITAFDVLALLMLQGLGIRVIEAVVLVLVGTIGLCYVLEIFVLPQTRPDFGEIGRALWPGLRETGMVSLAIAIIGATVMPHNLYLHSALVQSRQIGPDKKSKRQAIRYNTFDTVLALSLAFLVNAAILVLSALVFNEHAGSTLSNGQKVVFGPDSDWIQLAYLTLSPLVNVAAASILFGVALLASGQSSTITGTMAGQVVMEGFMHWRARPWLRRLVTRLLAILPAVLVIGLRGSTSVTSLINLSQVVLALQLPFAMFPLLHFTSSRKRMGTFANGWVLRGLGWTSFVLITSLALYGMPEVLQNALKIFSAQSE
jgi:manganese transport protein